MRPKKILLGFVALLSLLAGIVLAFGALQPGLARDNPYHPLTGAMASDFPLPASSDPWGTAFDSSGNVWVAVPGCRPSPHCKNSFPGNLEVFNPGSSRWTTIYQLPYGFGHASFLAFDKSGQLWFTSPATNTIGMYNPGQNVFYQYAVPTAGAGPWDITIDQQGYIWFTEHFSNKIARFDPVAQTFMEIATPATNSQPYGITVDIHNNIWFTENNAAVALIGEYTMAGSLLEYKIRKNPATNLNPHLITSDPSGNIWWTESFIGKIGELHISQAVPDTNKGIAEYVYPQLCTTCGMHAAGISIDSNGLVWFDDAAQSMYGSLPQSGKGAFSLYATPTANSDPYDGFNVDAQNRIWFGEITARKLAEAVQGVVATPTPTTSPTPVNTVTPTATLSPSPTPTSVLVVHDDFQRPDQAFWGTTADGQTWSGSANKLTAFSIVNGTGQVVRAGSGNSSYSAIIGPMVTDASVMFSGSLNIFGGKTNIGAVLRWNDPNNFYEASLNGSSLNVAEKVRGITTLLRSVPFTAMAGTSYALRFRIVGTVLMARVWPMGNPEPKNWMVSTPDTTFQAGYCGLHMQMAGTVTATFTEFRALELIR